MSNTVAKGDFIVVLKRALRDAETRELVAEELFLYDETRDPKKHHPNQASNTKQKNKAQNSAPSSEIASLEQRILELEKVVAKQDAQITAQGNDLARLWGLMQGKTFGHPGAPAALSSSQPEYQVHSADEDESDDEPPALGTRRIAKLEL
ncbi:hypothetical protein RhiJN_12955 [Ceratobasidium sp. AG-Ba]|nr:hypothetical protein RhiJN_12955 [Ceratobasidium sp. AG-Ba]